jgi:hypothetical protein
MTQLLYNHTRMYTIFITAHGETKNTQLVFDVILGNNNNMKTNVF